jgi:hypothetical protein
LIREHEMCRLDRHPLSFLHQQLLLSRGDRAQRRLILKKDDYPMFGFFKSRLLGKQIKKIKRRPRRYIRRIDET